MQYLSLFLCSLSFLSVEHLYSQEMGSHKWNDRILVISTDDLENELYKAQISEFRYSENELSERKLIVYQVHENEYRKGISTKGAWSKISNNELLPRTDTSGFEVILIGLDGGVKLRQIPILTKEVLFSIIDGMPMRRQEMRSQAMRKGLKAGG